MKDSYSPLPEQLAIHYICKVSKVPEILQGTVSTNNAYAIGVSIKRVTEVSPLLALKRLYRQILDYNDPFDRLWREEARTRLLEPKKRR